MRALPFALPAFAILALAGCGQQPARIALEPTATRLFGRGQQAKFHANPLSKRGEPMQNFACGIALVPHCGQNEAGMRVGG